MAKNKSKTTKRTPKYRDVYKVMREDVSTGRRKGKYGTTKYESAYKRGKNPTKRKVR